MKTELDILNRQIARIKEIRAIGKLVPNGDLLFDAWWQMAYREDEPMFDLENKMNECRELDIPDWMRDKATKGK